MGEGASFTDRYWPSRQEEKVIIPAMQARKKYTRASLKYKTVNKVPDEYLGIQKTLQLVHFAKLSSSPV